MTHDLPEEEEWAIISKDCLVLFAEHFSVYLLKSFVLEWSIDTVLREASHRLSGFLLMHSPVVDDLPDDADFLGLALTATADIVCCFTFLTNSQRAELNSFQDCSGVNVDDSDLSSLLTFGRILCRHYSLRGDMAAVNNAKIIIIDIFSLIHKSRSDESYTGILRDIWTKFSGDEFGKFEKVKSKHPKIDDVKKNLLNIANNVMETWQSDRPSSILYSIFHNSHKELVQRTSSFQPSQGKVDVSVSLPLPAARLEDFPLNSEKLNALHKVFDKKERSISGDIPCHDGKLLKPIRDYFKENPKDCLIVVPGDNDVSYDDSSSSPEKAVNKRKPKRKLLDLMKSSIESIGKKKTVSLDSLSDMIEERVVVESPHDSPPPSSTKPEPVRKSPRFSRIQNSKSDTDNPYCQALARGYATRVKTSSEKQKEAATNEGDAEIVSVPVASFYPSHPGKSRSGANTATPSVSAGPSLRERIGEIESLTSGSESSGEPTFDDTCDSDSEIKGHRRRRRRPWTKEEYRSIVSGVKRFGEGKWREIQCYYPELNRRTNVDVKDAYSRLVRNAGLKKWVMSK